MSNCLELANLVDNERFFYLFILYCWWLTLYEPINDFHLYCDTEWVILHQRQCRHSYRVSRILPASHDPARKPQQILSPPMALRCGSAVCTRKLMPSRPGDRSWWKYTGLAKDLLEEESSRELWLVAQLFHGCATRYLDIFCYFNRAICWKANGY